MVWTWKCRGGGADGCGSDGCGEWQNAVLYKAVKSHIALHSSLSHQSICLSVQNISCKHELVAIDHFNLRLVFAQKSYFEKKAFENQN